MRSTGGNSTYKKLAVQWLNEILCLYQSLCLVDNVVLRNCHLRVAAKRYEQYKKNEKTTDVTNFDWGRLSTGHTRFA